MDMREKIARAICWANCPRWMSDDAKTCQTESAWDMWLPEADAVLDAMREPDEAMVEAVAGQEQTRSDAKRIWRTMIDRARATSSPARAP